MGHKRRVPTPTARRTKSSRTPACRDTRRARHRAPTTSNHSGPRPNPGPTSTPTDRSDTFERAAIDPPAAAPSAPALTRAEESAAVASPLGLERSPLGGAPEEGSALHLVLAGGGAERGDTAPDTRR